MPVKQKRKVRVTIMTKLRKRSKAMVAAFAAALAMTMPVSTMAAELSADDMTGAVPETVIEAQAVAANKTEENKSEENKAEETKAEEKKVEESKSEESKAEETKAEANKVEENKAEETKAEENKAEETKAEENKAEEKAAETKAAPEKEEAAPVVKEAIKFTFHFENILLTNGTTKSSESSNTLKKGSGWTFTQKKLDNMVTAKSFSRNGVKYEYTGTWIDRDGNVVVPPISVKANDYDDDAEFWLSPVYKKTAAQLLTFRYVDEISTASGSWSNLDFFTSYTHTFREPDAAEHYQFLDWRCEDADVSFKPGSYLPGDKYTCDSAMIAKVPAGGSKEVTFRTWWQPSVTVNYYRMGELVKSEESFDGVSVYGAAPAESEAIEEMSEIAFDGWYDADGNRIDEETFCEAPAETCERGERCVIDAYAHYTTVRTVTVEWNDAEDQDQIRPESAEIRLFADSELCDEIITLSEENGWTYTFEALDAYGENGEATVYTADQTEVPDGYTAEVTEDGTVITVVNTHEPAPAPAKTEDPSGKGADDGQKTPGGGNKGGSSERPETKPDTKPESKPETPAPVNTAGTVIANRVVPEAVQTAEAETEETNGAVVTEADTAIEAAAEIETAEASVDNGAAAGGAEEIEEETVPLAGAVMTAEIIEEDAVPAAGPAKGAWALINLICAAFTAGISLLLLVTWFLGKRRGEEEEEENSENNEVLKRRGAARILSLIPAVAGVVLFLLTENMRNPMHLTDKWTGIMILILIAAVVCGLLSVKRRREEEPSEEMAEEMAV